MGYSPQLAAALTGATERQLQHWRALSAPLLVPETSRTRPVLYSFRDLVAVRTFVHLRQDVSLQSIRKAVAKLRDLGETQHLANYVLATDGKTIALIEGDEVTDLVKRPGQRVIAVLADVFRPFETRSGREVPDFEHPRPLLSVDPNVQGGHPVISGTRVPFDDVALLLQDDHVPVARITDYYPTVSAAAARDALDFHNWVQGRQPRAA